MDIARLLRERTDIIRLFYTRGQQAFVQMKLDIESEEGDWEPPQFNPDTDDGEPPFLAEWLQAEQTRELVGMLAVSLLSDTLKLYFEMMEKELRVQFTSIKERKATFKKHGFVEVYRQMLETITGAAYANCPVDFAMIEQVVLTRNAVAHNDDFFSFRTKHTEKTLKKHSNPFFVDDAAATTPGARPSYAPLMVEVSEAKIMRTVDEVEKLADWVSASEEPIWEWRQKQRSKGE
jgi:hypothetical protein